MSEQFKEKANCLLFEKFGSGSAEIRNTNGMWKIESNIPINGGLILWNSLIRFKHLRY